MPGNQNITSTVQSGETISLYASMYGCSVDAIINANKGKVGANGEVSEGAEIIIPIGQPSEKKAASDDVLQAKLEYFDRKLEEALYKLYDTSLTPQKREELEQEYINLKNLKKEREQAAEITLTGDGYHLTLNIKKEMTISEFRRLFPECGRNFSDYADDTKQTRYVNGKGFVRDPNVIKLRQGASFELKTQEYASRGFWTELGTSIRKTFGYKP